jgi:hypothetical protein
MWKSNKKEQPIVTIAKVNAHIVKPPRPLNYSCHICGIVGHKLTKCLKFDEMRTMFKGKGGKNMEIKFVIEVEKKTPFFY